MSQTQLEQKKVQMERETEHRAQVDAAVAYLKSLPRRGEIKDAPTPPDGLLEILRDLVIFEEDSPSAKNAKEIASPGRDRRAAAALQPAGEAGGLRKA